MASFTEQLAQAKRTAQLSGRPITKQEVSGIAEADQATATNRLNQAKQLSIQQEEVTQREQLQAKSLESQAQLQTQQLAQQKEIEDKRLAEQVQTRQAQMGAAMAAESRAESQQRQQTVVAAAGIGAYVASGTAMGGPVGGVLGLMVGLAATSYLCTETNNESGLSKADLRSLARFRMYAKHNHSGILNFYIENGPELTRAIAETEGENTKAFYDRLKEAYIMPVIVHSESSHSEQAFWVYRKMVVRLMKKYTPHIFKSAISAVRLDRQKFKEAA